MEHGEYGDFKEAIKLIRKIAKEEFRKENKHKDEDTLIAIENACLDFLEDRGL
jgi:hypothetical protein